MVAIRDASYCFAVNTGQGQHSSLLENALFIAIQKMLCLLQYNHFMDLHMKAIHQGLLKDQDSEDE